MDPAPETPAGFAFGRFLVFPHRRELLADGQPISLGGRAFDVLMALIEARGIVISKDALLARVWPDRVVEENNLHTHISDLRKVLGAERGLIRTIAGRGYQFTGEVRALSGSPDESAGPGTAAAQLAAALPHSNLPEPVSELIGRDAEVAEVVNLIGAHRLITLTGAGGIGKTQLALAAARRLLPHFADGGWVAELAPLADPDLAPGTVAAALGLELGGGAVSAQRVAQALAERRLLLVLDNCEHVIDAAALIAEALLRASPGVHVIATSREPLKAEGEWVYPVPALTVPAEDAGAEDDLQRYGAIWLFVVRSRASGAHVSEDRRGAAVITAICRRLDGIPLAIELAAARAAVLGIEEIAGRLDERFQLLTGGRRTALPRHQTLQATFDWSYALLSEPERVLLRRLGIFAGSFSLEAACAVATDGDLTSAEVIDGLASLVAKSLIAVDGESTIARYRMLHTMRAYALEKLAERGERDRLERRHAEYGRDVMERAESRLERSPTVRQLADLARLIDNVRANLDWAFSPAGDQSLGIALTAGAIPFWMHLSLMDECRGRVEQALAAIESRGMHDPVREMKLRAALGTSLLYTTGAPGSEIGAAWSKALALAESLNNAEYQLRSLRGLWSFHIGISPFDMTLHLAERFCSTAAGRPDPNEVLIGERMIGVSQHLHGEQDGARRRIEHMLAGYETTAQKSHVFRFQTDQRVLARVFLARVLWLQGMPKQATQTAERAVEEARATGHINSLCYALALAACPIALWTGDLNAAEHHIATLLDHSARHALPIWHAPALSHQGALAVKRGDVAAGLRLLRAGIDELGESRSALRYIPFVAELAEALGRNGQIPAGLAEAEEALGWTKRTENRWLMPELLRIQGDLFLLQGASDATLAAEDHFRQALDWARRQGALSWELRSATRLARLSYDEGRLGDASALLQPVYDRFTDGFDTADLKAAKALLDALN